MHALHIKETIHGGDARLKEANRICGRIKKKKKKKLSHTFNFLLALGIAFRKASTQLALSSNVSADKNTSTLRVLLVKTKCGESSVLSTELNNPRLKNPPVISIYQNQRFKSVVDDEKGCNQVFKFLSKIFSELGSNHNDRARFTSDNTLKRAYIGLQS